MVFMMSSSKTWLCLLLGSRLIWPGDVTSPTVDDRSLYSGGGTTPSFRSSSTGVGVSAWWTGSLLNLSGADRLCFGVHMINFHLELGQLWRCPVEWCVVWKGSVSDCLGHLQDKHGGSQYVALKNIAKFFPPWTVLRDLWMTVLRPDVNGIDVDARLFHEAGCRLVYKYRVYKDPFPHPALRGGGGGLEEGAGVLPQLSFMARAMAIAQLTHMHISIPASGAPPGQVPEECFPRGMSSLRLTDPVSPILQNSLDDLVVANVGSSREESNTLSEAVIATQTVVDALPVRMDSDVLADSPSPDVVRPFSGSAVVHVVLVTSFFWCRVRISEHDVSCLGLCVALWRVWHSSVSSTIPGMDWRPGVGWSIGDGTGEVATFVDSGSGYGCGCPAASGCLFDGHESARPPLAAGHGVENIGAGPRLQ